jgi:hypothetical protein
MEKWNSSRPLAYLTASVLPLVLAQPALAASGDIVRIQSFFRGIIQIGTGLASLVAVAFIVWGGLIYITSTGDPERLSRAKSTIGHSAVGLVIVIAAFIICNVVADLATASFGA